MTAKTTQYPLLFGFKERIFGQGFAAGVDLRGRAVAEEQCGEWWIYGVTPGAIADTGPNLVDAVASFRQRLKTVLVDFASEASNFASFKDEVERFFHATDAAAEAEWEAARDAVRAGKLDYAGLQKDTTAAEPTITVKQLELCPNENVIDGDDSSLAA